MKQISEREKKRILRKACLGPLIGNNEIPSKVLEILTDEGSLERHFVMSLHPPMVVRAYTLPMAPRPTMETIERLLGL